LELIQTFTKDAGHKINLEKLLSLFYTNDKWSEKEVRETLLFIIATNNLKYLVVTYTKQMKDMYNKNFKSWPKEIKRLVDLKRISTPQEDQQSQIT
jgi:type III secretory pathway component EscV